MKICPCGSGRDYTDCCKPYHDGQPAPSPEALMRSRYSAFVLKLEAYLLATWLPDTRPATLELDDVPWRGLRVIHAEGDRVEFAADFEGGQLHERSRFENIDGRWFYRDGEMLPPVKPGRNEACPCGSGRKYKKCCG